MERGGQGRQDWPNPVYVAPKAGVENTKQNLLIHQLHLKKDNKSPLVNPNYPKSFSEHNKWPQRPWS